MKRFLKVIGVVVEELEPIASRFLGSFLLFVGIAVVAGGIRGLSTDVYSPQQVILIGVVLVVLGANLMLGAILGGVRIIVRKHEEEMMRAIRLETEKQDQD